MPGTGGFRLGWAERAAAWWVEAESWREVVEVEVEVGEMVAGAMMGWLGCRSL